MVKQRWQPVATVLYPEDHQEFSTSLENLRFHVETAIMAKDGRLVETGEIGEIVHKKSTFNLGLCRSR